MSDTGFIKLVPEDVIRRWKFIGYYILQALAPTAADTEFLRGNIMSAIECRELEVWMAIKNKEIAAIYTLAVTTDAISATKHLVIYSLTAVRKIDRKLLEAGLENIKKQAKARGCQKIVSYTGIPSLTRLGKDFGASEFSTLVWNISE